MRLRLAINIAFLFIGEVLFAQYGNLPLNNDFQKIVVGGLADQQYNFHPSVKPYISEELDSLDERLISLNFKTESTVKRIIFNSDTGKAGPDQIELNISPIIQAQYASGRSNDTADQAQNLGLGFRLTGFAGKKVNFGFEYIYSNNVYADYVNAYIEQRGVVPGMGEAFRNGDHVVNKLYVGYVSYTPISFLNLQAGRGKQFIGNGYRSLLLSDNAAPSEFFKISVNIWKIKYQVLYSNLKNVQIDPISGISSESNKYSTSNLLSMNFGKHLNIGLYQSVIWYNNPDINRGFDVNYLNPVIFVRPVEFSVGSPDNIIMGTDVRYTFCKKYSIYGQLVLDEFLLSEFKKNTGWWGNKFGYQIGIKGNDVFKIKGLGFLAEYNWVRPYTYSHGNAYQNAGHYNEAMAHTLGANFKEFILQFSYTKKRWLVSLNGMMAQKGVDDALSNYGGDIFKSNTTRNDDYGNYTGQGISQKIQYYQFKLAYLVSPDWRLMFEVGLTHRSAAYGAPDGSKQFSEENNMIHVGFKTALYNQYLDF